MAVKSSRLARTDPSDEQRLTAHTNENQNGVNDIFFVTSAGTEGEPYWLKLSRQGDCENSSIGSQHEIGNMAYTWHEVRESPGVSCAYLREP